VTNVSLPEAQARLGELIDRVEAGETIGIEREGRVVALIERSAPAHTEPVDVDALARGASTLAFDPVDSVEAMRSHARF